MYLLSYGDNCGIEKMAKITLSIKYVTIFDTFLTISPQKIHCLLLSLLLNLRHCLLLTELLTDIAFIVFKYSPRLYFYYNRLLMYYTTLIEIYV